MERPDSYSNHHKFCFQHGNSNADVQHISSAGLRRSDFRRESRGVDLRNACGVFATLATGASACVACATPPSTAHAAIAAGTGWILPDTMLKYGLLWSVTAAVIFAVVGYPVGAMFM